MTTGASDDDASHDDSHDDGPPIEVVDVDLAGRYEVRVGGALAGFADRSIVDGQMVLPHTVVDPRFRGRGLAAVLVESALGDARERGLSVVPACSYVAAHIRDNPEHQDLVSPG